MAKRKAESQSANLTPGHKKSGIAFNYMCDDGVPHIIEKISTTDTTLLHTSPQLELCTRS
jgi:hypothetical protein